MSTYERERKLIAGKAYWGEDHFIHGVMVQRPGGFSRHSLVSISVRGRRLWLYALLLIRIAGLTPVPIDLVWREILLPYALFTRSDNDYLFPGERRSLFSRSVIYREDPAAMLAGEEGKRDRIIETEKHDWWCIMEQFNGTWDYGDSC